MPSLNQLLHEKRFRPPWRALLVLLALTAAVFAFTPNQGPVLDFEGADKLDHLMAFGSMGLVGALSWAAGRRSGLAVALSLLGYGAFIELVQTQVPGRTASWADLATDGVGIAAGLLLASLLRRVWPQDRA